MDETNNSATPNKNRSWLIIAILVLLVAAGVGGWYYFDRNKAAEPNQETPNNSEVVARVDGHEIKRAEYEQTHSQILASYTTQGVDVSAAESEKMIKEQAINSLVNRQLLVAAAKAKNYTATDTAVETEYQTILTSAGGAEAFAAALKASGLDETAVREDIRNGLIIQQYLNAEVGLDKLTVTDAEVTAYYEQAKQANAELPPLADVSAAIKEQLMLQKRDVAINDLIAKMRAGAKVEILI